MSFFKSLTVFQNDITLQIKQVLKLVTFQLMVWDSLMKLGYLNASHLTKVCKFQICVIVLFNPLSPKGSSFGK